MTSGYEYKEENNRGKCNTRLQLDLFAQLFELNSLNQVSI